MLHEAVGEDGGGEARDEIEGEGSACGVGADALCLEIGREHAATVYMRSDCSPMTAVTAHAPGWRLRDGARRSVAEGPDERHAISQCEHFLFCKLSVCHNFLQFIIIVAAKSVREKRQEEEERKRRNAQKFGGGSFDGGGASSP